MRKKAKTRRKVASIKSLIRKLDVVTSKIVRSQGYCSWCGLTEYSKLQACHIFSRKYRSVRWDVLNVICLCSGCHMKGHHQPVIFTEFVQEYLGKDNYEILKTKALIITKRTRKDLEDLLNHMTEQFIEQYDASLKNKIIPHNL